MSRQVYQRHDSRTRRADIRRWMRSILILCLMIVAFCSGFFGHTILSAHAEEEQVKPLTPYYKSIQIRHDDTLWDIAQTYSDGSGYTTQQYVDELKRMNHLESEQIHSGEFLTIVYYAE